MKLLPLSSSSLPPLALSANWNSRIESMRHFRGRFSLWFALHLQHVAHWRSAANQTPARCPMRLRTGTTWHHTASIRVGSTRCARWLCCRAPPAASQVNGHAFSLLQHTTWAVAAAAATARKNVCGLSAIVVVAVAVVVVAVLVVVGVVNVRA